jgi:hypothetical protein
LADRKFIFVSSSPDLADTRRKIASELGSWLEKHGISDAIAPYLWEEETDSGRMLSDRMPIQPQLPDPLDANVPFTACLFGERCGVPLQDDLSDDWEKRIASWRERGDGRGLIHPWPATYEKQKKALENGGFPLTGTIFELISACSVDPEHDNLVIGMSPTTSSTGIPARVTFFQSTPPSTTASRCREKSERGTGNTRR